SGDPAPRVALAQTLSRQGKFPQAIAVLQPVPDSAEARNVAGLARMRLGDLARAEAEFREAVRLRPEIAAIRNNLAAALMRLRALEGAIREYKAALAVRPGSFTI